MKNPSVRAISVVAALVILFSFSGCAKKSAAIKAGTSSENTESKSSVNTSQEKNGQGNTEESSKGAGTPAVIDTGKEPYKSEVKQPAFSGKVIVIDPGHANRSNLEKEPNAPGSSIMKIKDGGGAEGVVTNTPEYLINMKVAVKLKKQLEQKGFTVVMTKTENSQSLGNVDRASIWNKANATLVIRIHADSDTNQSTKGASMLVPAASVESTKSIYKESKRCGSIVLDSLIKSVGMASRGVIERNDMTGFNWSKVPVILIEMGYLSNPSEDKLLSTDEYQEKIAQGLAQGIESAMK